MGKRANGEGSVYQRESDGLWVAKVSIPGTLPTKYICRYRKTQKEALAKLQELQQQVRINSVPIAPLRMTVAEYLDSWLADYVKGKLEPQTERNYRSNVEQHLKPGLGRIRLHSLTTPQVQRFFNDTLAK